MTLSPPTANAMRRALHRAQEGVALDVTEAAVLLQARDGDLTALSAVAARVRDAGLEAAGRPGVVTYSRKVFVPLTRLCRDKCHYCTFVTVPGKLRRDGHGMFLSPDEVLDIARRGAAMGCKEALFTLGDRPEDRWPEAREWLDAHGYDDTLAYVRAMSIRVLEETGLLPHLNPGVLSWTDLQRLKPVAPSMGMMLETTATRLWSEPGGPHHGSPDKEPAVRLRVLEDAGRSNVPFTTGILIGIGETYEERAESLFAIRRVARRYHGVQEVIVQNFRAKPDTAMRGMPDAELEELAAAIAVARLVLGPSARIQAPPNLVDGEYARFIEAGIDDWGGVSPLTPDHVNPERPWPQIDELAARTAEAGFALRERLTIYPEFVRRGEPWLDPRLLPHVTRAGRPGHRAGPPRTPKSAGRPWQEPEDAFPAAGGRTDLHRTIDTEGRTGDRRDDFDDVYGDWEALREQAAPGLVPDRVDADVKRGAVHGRRRPDAAHRRPGARPAARRRPGAGRPVPDRRRPAQGRRRRRRDVHRHQEHQLHQRLLHRLPVLRLRAAPHRRRRVHPLPRPGRRPGRSRRGRWARSRSACRAASTRTCPAAPTSTSPARSRSASPACTCTPSRRWRSSTARPAPGCPIREWLARGQGGGPGHHPGHRGRDPGRRGPLGADQGQTADRHLGRGGQHRAPAGHPLLVHDDVRPRRPAAPLARPPAAAGPDAAGRLRRAASPSS